MENLFFPQNRLEKKAQEDLFPRNGIEDYLRDYLDSLKGKELKGKAKVGYLIYKDVCHNSVLASPDDPLTIVLVFDDGTMMGLPYEHFQTLP
jgi:hypothetical protein